MEQFASLARPNRCIINRAWQRMFGGTFSMVDESPTALMTISQLSAENAGGADSFWRDAHGGAAALARSNRWVAKARLRELITRHLTPLAKCAAALVAPTNPSQAASQISAALARWGELLDGAESVGDLVRAYARVADDYLALSALVSPQQTPP